MELVATYGDSSGEEQPVEQCGETGHLAADVDPLVTLQRAIDSWSTSSRQLPDEEDERRRRLVVADLQRLCDVAWDSEGEEVDPQSSSSVRRKRQSDDPTQTTTHTAASLKARKVTSKEAATDRSLLPPVAPTTKFAISATSGQSNETTVHMPSDATAAAPHNATHRVIVKPFGSWHYNLHLKSSDIDVNMWAKRPIPNFFETLSRILSLLSPPISLSVTPRARIPSAKLCLHGIDVDIVHECGDASDFEHSMAISEWVTLWLSKFRNIAPVCRFVKCWASAAGINKSYAHTLPSLALLVMLFSVAEEVQTRKEEALFPALLLTTFFSKFATWPRKCIIRTTDCVASPPSEAYERYDAENTDGFGETVYIQDPFLARINLGRFVTFISIQKILLAFKRAEAACRDRPHTAVLELTIMRNTGNVM